MDEMGVGMEEHVRLGTLAARCWDERTERAKQRPKAAARVFGEGGALDLRTAERVEPRGSRDAYP
jgi:hypothetical protein